MIKVQSMFQWGWGSPVAPWLPCHCKQPPCWSSLSSWGHSPSLQLVEWRTLLIREEEMNPKQVFRSRSSSCGRCREKEANRSLQRAAQQRGYQRTASGLEPSVRPVSCHTGGFWWRYWALKGMDAVDFNSELH